jgi:carbamoyltransferase
MNILGINLSHNPSICLYKDGKIKNLLNEERFVSIKDYELNKDFEVFKSIEQYVKEKPEMVCYASYGRNGHYAPVSDYDLISKIQKQLDNPPYYFDIKEHHLYHATCGFYFSKFNDAVAIVVDGGGASNKQVPYQEVESIYFINKKKIIPFYKHHNCYRFLGRTGIIPQNNYIKYDFYNGYTNKFSNELIGGQLFEEACKKAGFNFEQDNSGKLMGLSSYAYTDKKYNLNYGKVEIAKQAQEKLFNDTCNLIEMVKHKTKNVILSGGCALNCSNNFKYVKKYSDLNFFIDPIPHDAGTAIGVALYYDNYK